MRRPKPGRKDLVVLVLGEAPEIESTLLKAESLLEEVHADLRRKPGDWT